MDGSNIHQTYFNNTEYEVLTPDGWSYFSGLVINHDTRHIKLVDHDLVCTPDHRLLVDGKFVEAKDLPHEVVAHQVDSYDLFEVEKNHQYFTNDVVSHNCSLIYLDEHAFIPRWEEFAASVLPTLSSGKETRLILSSTPNGLNHFYDYMEGAKKKTNGFWWIEVPWHMVPGRDEKWKEKTLADLNHDQAKFEQEFDLHFMGSSGTLISGSALKRLQASTAASKSNGISVYQPAVKDRIYVALADVSHGKGLDYSTIQVIDITEMPYKQVCTYRSNTVTPTDFATIISQIGTYYNKAYVLVENNDIGAQVTYILWNELDYENVLSSTNRGRGGKILNFGVPKKSDIGIRVTKTVKSLGCSVLKLLVEQGQLIICDKDTIGELNTFSKVGSSYEAEEGKHDDLVMPLVSFAWMTTTELFREISSTNAVKDMTDYAEDQLARNILGAGIAINNGIDEAPSKKYIKLEGDDTLWEEAEWKNYGLYSSFN